MLISVPYAQYISSFMNSPILLLRDMVLECLLYLRYSTFGLVPKASYDEQ